MFYVLRLLMLYYMLLAFVNWLRVTLILLTTLLILKERKKLIRDGLCRIGCQYCPVILMMIDDRTYPPWISGLTFFCSLYCRGFGIHFLRHSFLTASRTLQ